MTKALASTSVRGSPNPLGHRIVPQRVSAAMEVRPSSFPIQSLSRFAVIGSAITSRKFASSRNMRLDSNSFFLVLLDVRTFSSMKDPHLASLPPPQLLALSRGVCYWHLAVEDHGPF